MKYVIIPWLLTALISVSQEEKWFSLYENRKLSWMERWEPLVEHSLEMSPQTRIQILSHLLGNETNPNYTEAQRNIAREVTRVLLDTPGHAKYFGDQIKQSENDPNRWIYFHKLKHLPSPETVRVLGKFLSDDRGRPELAEDGSNLEEYALADPNCDRAARTLKKMLADPPVPKDTGWQFARDLEPWRMWWERVKAGNQTYRFVGDDTVYDLRGPVRGEGEANTSRSQKKIPQSTPSGSDTQSADKPNRLLPYLLGGLFLLAGFFYLLRVKFLGD